MATETSDEREPGSTPAQSSDVMIAADPARDAWDRLKDIVADALEQPCDERLAFIEQTCGDDPDLFAEVIDLVGASDEDTAMLDPRTDAFIGLSGPDTASLDGRRIGQYRLIRLLGEGAMASVYFAKQDDVDRPVALKVFRPHALGHDAMMRFRREVAALGRVQHPSVARIYEANIHYDADLPGRRGLPYIAMEHVDGLPVTEFAEQHKLDAEQRVKLIADIADAVHAAHQRAIVHRDLKPANVLVVPDGHYGTPKVLDFGIARVLEEADPMATHATSRVQTMHTTTGVLLGTLGYMAPEQARGAAELVDIRSDVFALGVMLHELLTGKRPVETEGLPLTEVLRRLSEPAIPNPTNIDGDWRTILQTALEPDPNRRYPSAEALADDLRRSLRHEPINARPPTRMYLARKFIRRHRTGVVAAAAVLIALLGGTVAATVGFVREARARETAELQALRAMRASDFLRSMLVSADPGEMGREVTVLEMIRAAEPRIAVEFADDPITEASLRGAWAQTLNGLGYRDEADVQYARQLELAKQIFGTDSEPVVATTAERAGLLLGSGEVGRADVLLGDADDAAKRLPLDSRGRILYDEAHANLLISQGDYDAGIPAYADVYERASASTNIDPSLFDTLANNYAVTLAYLGDYRTAAEVDRKVIGRRATRLGADHYDTLSADVNYAQVLRQFDPKAAVKILDNAVPKLIDALGPTHPTTISARRGRAELLSDLGESDQAIALLRELLIDAEPLGDSSVMVIHNSLGAALSNAKRFDEAVDEYRLALKAVERLDGPEHPETLSTRANLATALGSAGDNEMARKELREILEINRRNSGPDNVSTLINMNNLAMVDLELGRFDEAVSLLRQVLAGFVAQGLTANTPIIRRNLGRALTKAKQYEEAETVLSQSFTDAQALLSKSAQARTAMFVAELYEDWGKPDEAKAWHEVEAELTPK